MKRRLLLLVTLITAVAAHCADFTVDNLTFTTLDDAAHTVQLTNASFQSEELNIPETVEYEGVTYTVTSVNLKISSWSPNLGAGITTVTVSKTVEEIVNLRGGSLKSVLFAEGSRLKTIADNAFQNFAGTEITLPESVETIGMKAFYRCSNLTTVNILGHVKTIGESTFEWCYALTAVSLPADVEAIGTKAFYYCQKLRSITIPGKVKTIGESAFESCIELIDVTLSAGVETIGAKAFYKCAALEKVNISGDINTISESAFEGCWALTDITLPAGVETIGARAFYECRELPSISIPGKLKAIGESAFERCWELTDITMPDCVEIIGTNAFYYCQKLRSVTIPGTVKTISDGAFQYCELLADITLSEGVETIGAYAFYITNRNLLGTRTVVLPSSLTSIGHYAFTYAELHLTCPTPPAVEADVFNETVRVVVDDYELFLTYLNTDVWKDYVKGPELAVDGLTYQLLSDSEVELVGRPKDRQVITIPEAVDYGTRRMAVTAIRDYTFGYENIWETLPDSSIVEELYVKPQLTTLGVQHFPATLRHIELPKSLKRIEDYTFENCGQLKDINVPEDLEYIGSYSFSKTAIESFVVPAKVTKLELGTFGDCKSLRNVTLHDDITRLVGAFWGTPIASIKLPANLKVLTDGCFRDCENLTELSLPDGIESITIDVVGGNTGVTELRVPHTVYSLFFSEPYGGKTPQNLKNVFVVGSTDSDRYYDVDGVVFRRTNALDRPNLIYYPFNRDAEEYTVPDGTYGIYREAFKGVAGVNGKLKKVNLPEGLVSISDYAFMDRCGLETVNMPQSLMSIRDEAFKGDRRLNVRIPASVTNIGNNAFSVNTISLDVVDPSTLNCKTFSGSVVCVKPEAVEAYRNDAFWGQYTIVSDIRETDGFIYLPEGEAEARLAGYVKLPEGTLDIPQTVTIDGKQRSVTSIGPKALSLALFDKVNVPSTVTTIGASCFTSCDSLKSADIGDAKMDLVNFFDCDNLKEITVGTGNAYHSLSDGLLYSREMDTLQVYPKTSDMEAFVLPQSVKYIGSQVQQWMLKYEYDGNLRKLYSLSPTIPEWLSTNTNHLNAVITLYVPEALVKTYRNTRCWSAFENIVGLTDEEVSDILTGISETKAADAGRTADDAYYTISGVRVTKPGKGLYIHKGKKLVIR